MTPTRNSRVPLLATVAFLGFTRLALADIPGFGNFSGFTVNQSDGHAAPTVAPGLIHLTNSSFFEDRSIFYNTPQTITHFTASFTYQAQNSGSAFAGGCGAAFVIQNSPSGTAAVGSGTVGSTGITKSVALTLELYASTSASGEFANGAAIVGSTSTAPLNIVLGDPINVSLSYDGSILQETLFDTITSASYGNSFLVNIPTLAGASTAYVGLTAANTGNQAAIQTFSNFQFSNNTPEPASLSLLTIAALPLLRRRHRA